MKFMSAKTARIIVSLIFFLFLKGFCFSQTGGQSLNQFGLNHSNLNFRRQLNIYQWIYSFSFQKRLENKLEFKIDEAFSSTLQRISSRDLWKDSQSLTLNFSYPLSRRISFEPIFTSRILSDPLAGFNNDIQFYSSSARLNFQPSSNIRISPRVSSKWQTQVGQSDHGFSYGGEASVSDFDLYGYESEISLLGGQDFFPHRRNEDLKLRYKIARKFYESTADTLIIIFDRLRRDTFGAAPIKDSMGVVREDTMKVFVRNLTQSNRGFENRLSYKVGSNTLFFFKNSIFSRTFRVNNLEDETTDLRKDDSGFESENSAKLRIQKSNWFTDVTWNYKFRSREDLRPRDTTPDPFGRHPSVGFDSEDILTGLGLRSGFRVDANDSLGISASVTKFQYTTSDTVTPNDHDQIKWQFTFTHSHQFSEDLRLVWRGSVFLNHFVFISRKFSGGNNWQRFIQLKPEVVYQPSKNLSIRQGFTVRAKYQTFDFDDAETGLRNTVNRQFIIFNKSHFALTSKSSFELGVNLELAEQGRFFINGWRQSLALSWRNQQVNALYKKRIGANFHFSAGLNFFRQVRWNHKVDQEGKLKKSVRSKHTNFGPVWAVTFRPSSSLELLFFGNIDVVHSSGRSTKQINNFNLDLKWFL